MTNVLDPLPIVEDRSVEQRATDGDLAREVHLITPHARLLAAISRLRVGISQENLARQFDVTMRTMQRYLDDLEAEGLVAVDRTKKPFHYTLNDQPVDGIYPSEVIRLLTSAQERAAASS